MKKITIVATEIDLKDGFNHLRYIRFPLDAGKDFCYRSRVSYNSFKENGRNYNRNGIMYHLGREEEKHNIEGVPVLDVENIWEFYKSIKYNYKTKKYL